MTDSKTNQLTFCPATNEDISAIFEQCEILIRTYEDLESIDISKVLMWVEDKIRSNIGQYVCVRMDGCKAAYYRLDVNDGEAELDDLYVLPEFRGKGIGSQVLQRCISSTDVPIFLYVFSKNIGAIRLYEKHGFVMSQKIGNTRWIMRRNTEKK